MPPCIHTDILSSTIRVIVAKTDLDDLVAIGDWNEVDPDRADADTTFPILVFQLHNIKMSGVADSYVCQLLQYPDGNIVPKFGSEFIDLVHASVQAKRSPRRLGPRLS